MTDKKLDPLDGMLYYGAMGNDPVQFLDYPETVVQTLRILYTKIKFPSAIIPRKKTKSKFEEWIKELQEIISICPNSKKLEMAIDKIVEKKDNGKLRFIFSRPASIKNFLIDVVAEINREEEKLQKNKLSPIEEISVASVMERKKAVSDLKSMFEE